MAPPTTGFTIGLRATIISIFVTLIVGTAGLIGYISFRNGQQAVNNLADQTLDTIQIRIQQNLENFLSTPHDLNQINAHDLRSGLVDPRDFSGLRKRFLHQVQAFDSVMTCAFGSERGEFIGAGRRSEGVFDTALADKTLDNDYRVYLLDEQGQPGELVSVVQDYHPRPRPWYQAALKAKGPAWSPIYVWASEANIGISAVLPVYDNAGDLLGVQQSALSLGRIGGFLQNIKVGHTGLIFIIERSGLLVASSISEPLVRHDPAKPDAALERVQATESANPLIRATAAYLKAQLTDLHGMSGKQRRIVALDGQTYFLSVTSSVDERGLDWLVVIVIPESDLMGPVQSNIFATVLAGLIAVIGAILLGVRMTRWITCPIMQLSGAAQEMSRGKWEKAEGDIHIREVSQLAASFNSMAEQLHESFATLEHRVQERTRELAAANDHLQLEILERKRAEEERLRLDWQVQQMQKAESLGRMAGAIAHHFNNQLGAVMGNLELALLELPQGAKPGEKITEAILASRRAAEISRLMLAYLGQSIGSRVPLDLSEACREALPLLGASLPKTVQLKTEFPDVGPVIRADAMQILQVLTNLVVNAGEAIGNREGEITVSLAQVPATELGVSRFYPPDWQPGEDRYACLAVSDNGSGMEPATFEKIFDPFFTTKFTGRGLGLAVVLGVVKAHEGAVTVASSLGRGALFRVFLPLSDEQPQAVVKVQPIASVSSGDRDLKAGEASFSLPSTPAVDGDLVLLVEDEPIMRNMAATMLALLGCEVITAADGVEALEVFYEHRDRIRCVLLDLTMPRMGGWETLVALRAMRADLPVILASGYDEVRAMAVDHPERPQAFLQKPYRMMELQVALEAALRGQTSQ